MFFPKYKARQETGKEKKKKEKKQKKQKQKQKEKPTKKITLQPDEDLRRVRTHTAAKFRAYVNRYDVKLRAASGENSEAEAIKICSTFMALLKESDPNVVLLPYSKIHADFSAVHGNQTMPLTFYTMGAYFHGLKVIKKGGFTYCKIWLAHDKSAEHLLRDMKFHLGATNEGMWLRQLSHEEVWDAGWLLYSSRDTNGINLAEEITLLSGIPCSVRWRRVYYGVKNPKVLVYASHLECPKMYSGAFETWLDNTYSSSADPLSHEFPLGMFFRRIPSFRNLFSRAAKDKVVHLANRQAQFSESVGKMITWEIMSLDRIDKSTNTSLRDILMSIKSSTLKNTRLFHAINPAYNSDGFVITFLPQLKDEAITLIAALPVYCRHFYGESVNKWFSPEAVHRTREAAWDEKLGYATSKRDFALGNLVDLDTAFHAPKVSIELPPEMKDGTDTTGTANIAGETDSVSTFQNNKPAAKPPERDKAQPNSAKTEQKSVVSAISIESRMSKVEETSKEQSKQLRQITQQLGTLMEHLIKPTAAAAGGRSASGKHQ